MRHLGSEKLKKVVFETNTTLLKISSGGFKQPWSFRVWGKNASLKYISKEHLKKGKKEQEFVANKSIQSK